MQMIDHAVLKHICSARSPCTPCEGWQAQKSTACTPTMQLSRVHCNFVVCGPFVLTISTT